MSELSTRLRLRRKELGLSQEELAQRMGYRSKSSITKLEKGVNDLPQAKLEELAAALETTPAYLLGLDAPCPPPGFEPLPAMVRVPLIGSIACGTPITAEQNVERYIGVPAAWRADFALTCHGNSMSPTICDGGYRMHPLPAGGGAGPDRSGAHRQRGHPQALPSSGEHRDAHCRQRCRLPADGLHRPAAGRTAHRGPGRRPVPGAVSRLQSFRHVS